MRILKLFWKQFERKREENVSTKSEKRYTQMGAHGDPAISARHYLYKQAAVRGLAEPRRIKTEELKHAQSNSNASITLGLLIVAPKAFLCGC